MENNKAKINLEENLEITENTKLSTLIERYPWITDSLVELNPSFKMLKTRVARIILPKVTIKNVSERANIQIDELINKLNTIIKEHSN